MKVILTLEIDYDVTGYNDPADALSDVQDVLHTSIDRLVGEGGLSGSTPAEVDSWDVHTSLDEG